LQEGKRERVCWIKEPGKGIRRSEREAARILCWTGIAFKLERLAVTVGVLVEFGGLGWMVGDFVDGNGYGWDTPVT
jgi:hypothetical protein